MSQEGTFRGPSCTWTSLLSSWAHDSMGYDMHQRGGLAVEQCGTSHAAQVS
jgi:hypothetical protein